jgi:iron complex transport system substrate-binding protein
LAGLLATTLVACGSDDDETSAESDTEADGGSESGAEPAGSATEADPDAFPVTIEDKYGETTIEQEPERVAVVGLTEQDALLALGVVPTGTTEWYGEYPGAIWPWAEDELEALGGETPEILTDGNSINVEAVAANQPDLIVAMYAEVSETQYEQLSAIAPTLAQPEGEIDFGVSWQEVTLTLGEALGRSERAEELVDEVEALFDQAREDHPDFEGATAVSATPYDGIYVYGPTDPRGRFLTTLGFELPEDLVEVTGDEFGGNLSEERADMIDTDLIIWLDPEDGDGPLGGPLYETFDVHTEGREVFLDSFRRFCLCWLAPLRPTKDRTRTTTSPASRSGPGPEGGVDRLQI